MHDTKLAPPMIFLGASFSMDFYLITIHLINRNHRNSRYKLQKSQHKLEYVTEHSIDSYIIISPQTAYTILIIFDAYINHISFQDKVRSQSLDHQETHLV
jgi:hypothetical protein